MQEVKSDSEEFWSGIKNLKPQDTETMKQEDAANLQTAVTEVAQLVS